MRTTTSLTNGADLFLSIHWNSCCNTTSRYTVGAIDSKIDWNDTRDVAFASQISRDISTTFNFTLRPVRSQELVVLRDTGLGNTDFRNNITADDYFPVTAALVETEFMSNPEVDRFFWCPDFCCIDPVLTRPSVADNCDPAYPCTGSRGIPAVNRQNVCDIFEMGLEIATIDARFRILSTTIRSSIVTYILDINNYPTP